MSLMSIMPDYKEMYLKMFRASEQAINILIAIATQQGQREKDAKRAKIPAEQG
jgi:hypothetical protein